MQGAAIITRRKNQAGFYKSGMTCPNQVIGGVLFCQDDVSRDGWIRRLSQVHPLRYNYFVKFRDVNGCALSFGHAEWVKPGTIHVG